DINEIESSTPLEPNTDPESLASTHLSGQSQVYNQRFNKIANECGKFVLLGNIVNETYSELPAFILNLKKWQLSRGEKVHPLRLTLVRAIIDFFENIKSIGSNAATVIRGYSDNSELTIQMIQPGRSATYIQSSAFGETELFLQDLLTATKADIQLSFDGDLIYDLIAISRNCTDAG
ncbi:hypothetical protein WDZ92_53590, partial [Nostoc sp. NIES-2111]